MKKRNMICVMSLAGVLTASSLMQVYGASGPGQAENPIPDGVSEAQWSKLNDQSLDFDELSGRVRYFNPSILNIKDSIGTSLDDLRYTYDAMRRSIMDTEDSAKELKDSGAVNTKEGMEQYMTLSFTANATKKAADALKDKLDLLNRTNSSLNTNITQAVDTNTYYADQIMVGYNSAAASRAMLQKLVDISQAAYEAQTLSRQVGLATETDVLSAQKGVLSAQSSLLKVDSTIDSLKRSLCLMTGYSPDAAPEINGLPELKPEDISGIDLQADTAKAIGNNYALIGERRASSNKTTTGMKNKEDNVSQAEQGVAVTMQSYYQAVMQAKSAYEAACTTYERAGLENEKADRSYQLGMLSKITYLQAQMSFLQAESGKQNAYNTLYQAYDTYQWAVKGIIMAPAS